MDSVIPFRVSFFVEEVIGEINRLTALDNSARSIAYIRITGLIDAGFYLNVFDRNERDRLYGLAIDANFRSFSVS